MNAYVGTVDRMGLRWFVVEDAIPGDLLQHYLREWTSRSTTAVWALFADEDIHEQP
jgi:hypothetical protein